MNIDFAWCHSFSAVHRELFCDHMLQCKSAPSAKWKRIKYKCSVPVEMYSSLNIERNKEVNLFSNNSVCSNVWCYLCISQKLATSGRCGTLRLFQIYTAFILPAFYHVYKAYLKLFFIVKTDTLCFCIHIAIHFST